MRMRAVEKIPAEKDADHLAWLEYKEAQEFRQATALKILDTSYHISEESRDRL